MDEVNNDLICLSFSASPTIKLFSATLASLKPLACGVLWLGQLSIGQSNRLTNLEPFLVLGGEIIHALGPHSLLNGVEISGSSVSKPNK